MKADLQWCGGYVLVFDKETNADLLVMNLTKTGTVKGHPGKTVKEVATAWCVANGYELTTNFR